MKDLVNDIISIFNPKTVTPVLVRTGLSHREVASLQAVGVATVSWATSMEELNSAFVKKALDADAVGYHITNVESHKPGKEDQHVMAATATFYHINHKAAYG